MTVQLYLGDCLEVMATLAADSVDTIITDPPYALTDKHGARTWQYGEGGKKNLGEKRGGFMGMKWDGDLPGAEVWVAALRVAKPGAMMLAFGGTRTWHRLVCAIEDAGWEVRDTMMWLYGSGFPKSHDISKAIDKAAGAEREVVGTYSHPDGRARPNSQRTTGTVYGEHGGPLETPLTAPATPADATWQGWGTALKPAWEPIIVAMKPLSGTFAQNALEHGVAGLWIDGGRVPTNGDNLSGGSVTSDRKAPMAGDGRTGAALGMFAPGSKRKEEWVQPTGRWPANLLLSHHPECEQVGTRRVKGGIAVNESRNSQKRKTVYGDYNQMQGENQGYADADGYETVEDWRCHPDCPVRLLGEQSGERAGMASQVDTKDTPSRYFGLYKKAGIRFGRGDTGTAARFFYCAKASNRERWFYCRICGDAFPAAERSEHGHGMDDNAHIVMHPTQKPQELMRYLVRLTKTPTGGVVLDPFSGSGTTGIACVHEGRDFIGIEIDPTYYAIAEKRIAEAQMQLRLPEVEL